MNPNLESIKMVMQERIDDAQLTINRIEQIKSLPDESLFRFNPGYSIHFGGNCKATLRCENMACDQEFAHLLHSILTKHILAGLEELKNVIEEQIMGAKIYDDE